jgi:hypothetical protein
MGRGAPGRRSPLLASGKDKGPKNGWVFMTPELCRVDCYVYEKRALA